MKSYVLLLTYVTPLISKPLDATSVAISTRTRPVLKSSRACSRSHCSLQKTKHSGKNHIFEPERKSNKIQNKTHSEEMHLVHSIVELKTRNGLNCNISALFQNHHQTE